MSRAIKCPLRDAISQLRTRYTQNNLVVFRLSVGLEVLATSQGGENAIGPSCAARQRFLHLAFIRL